MRDVLLHVSLLLLLLLLLLAGHILVLIVTVVVVVGRYLANDPRRDYILFLLGFMCSSYPQIDLICSRVSTHYAGMLAIRC